MVQQPHVTPITTKKLNPQPNDELNKTRCNLIAKKITKGMPVEQIVQIIFDANPTDIKKIYSTQLEGYSKKIIELNKDCFREDSNIFFFKKDTLEHIPLYKK